MSGQGQLGREPIDPMSVITLLMAVGLFVVLLLGFAGVLSW